MTKKELRLNKIYELEKELCSLELRDYTNKIRINKEIAALYTKTELKNKIRSEFKHIIRSIEKGYNYFDNVCLCNAYKIDLEPFVSYAWNNGIYISDTVDNAYNNLFMTYYYINRNKSNWNMEEYKTLRKKKYLKLLVNKEDY